MVKFDQKRDLAKKNLQMAVRDFLRVESAFSKVSVGEVTKTLEKEIKYFYRGDIETPEFGWYTDLGFYLSREKRFQWVNGYSGKSGKEISLIRPPDRPPEMSPSIFHSPYAGPIAVVKCNSYSNVLSVFPLTHSSWATRAVSLRVSEMYSYEKVSWHQAALAYLLYLATSNRPFGNTVKQFKAKYRYLSHEQINMVHQWIQEHSELEGILSVLQGWAKRGWLEMD